MRNTLIGVVSSVAMGAALLATAAPAWADNDNWGPGPYGIAGPGTGKVVPDNSYWGPRFGYGYADNGNSGLRSYPAGGNIGAGPYGMGGPGTGKVVAYP
jgi:hypothetical protein